MKSTTITELHGKPTNDGEFKNSFLMVVNALLGTHGYGDWGTGRWWKRGFTWSAKQVVTSFADITLPFRMVDDVVFLHDLSGVSVVSYAVYIADGKAVSYPSLNGKKVLVQVIDSKITKEVL